MKSNKSFFPNKKAFFTDPLVDFFVYVVFIIVVIFLFTLIQFSGSKERTIKSEFQDINVEKIMLNYLKTPIKIEDKDIQMSDLFMLFYYSESQDFIENHKKMIKGDLRRIFRAQGKFFCYSLEFPILSNNDVKQEIISDCIGEGDETSAGEPNKLEFIFPNLSNNSLRIKFTYYHFVYSIMTPI
ncbi:hypothetical protein CMO93_03300 [Candidatus Woesearchaeota archaeon]|nr:hypothetical protein [Candidatus Woesearchaeota archaeon]|tara:strand:+ start:939 stop:1490 length:552 start_codon:yes stop_codon:yes gene_type:complete